MKISIIIPAKNEASSLEALVNDIMDHYPDAEIIVINDGSSDNTQAILKALPIKTIEHPYSLGNGAAIKAGARLATGDCLLFMDGDGQHQATEIAPLLKKYSEGYDMVVGQRSKDAQASTFRYIGNAFYNTIASWVVNQPVKDLTSGMRLVNAQKFKAFLFLLPNGFSAPSTITMAFFRSGYTVAYCPITVKARIGKSHLNPLSDGIRFFIILYKMTVLYSPLKVFLPLALLHFLLGCLNYAMTYASDGRFTNMSAVLFSGSIFILLMGVISEQITTLLYQNVVSPKENNHETR